MFIKFAQQSYDMKKRILLLSHIPPYPAVGGDHIRICQGVDFLTRHFEVDIAFITHRRDVVSQKSFNSAIVNEYSFYVPPVLRALQAVRTIVNGRAEVVNHYDNSAMRRFVAAHAHEYSFIFCASTVMAQYVMGLNGVKSYLDMTDSLAMNRETAAKMSHGIRQYLLKTEARRLKLYETEALKYFHRTAYISEVDASFICGGAKCIVGNSVSFVPEADCCRHTPDSRNILFTGIMDYEPNVAASSFFAREVMPLIRRDIPDVTFTIAGKSPSAKVRELAALRGVCVTGFVESLTPLYRDCALVVAPMLSGSGVQNKILQALACGCCVVTTSKGAEGIEQLSDSLVICKADPAVMAAWVVQLLHNPEKRRKIGELGRRQVSEGFGLEHTDEQYRKFLDM